MNEESQSAWSSLFVVVRKPGKVRLCLYSNKVNSVSIKDVYPLPNIEGILSRVPNAKFITSLDLKNDFWQIPFDKRSQEYPCFIVSMDCDALRIV